MICGLEVLVLGERGWVGGLGGLGLGDLDLDGFGFAWLVWAYISYLMHR